MDQNGTLGGQKRSLPQADDEVPSPTSTKKRRLDEGTSEPAPSTNPLSAIASAISSAFGYGKQPQNPAGDKTIEASTQPAPEPRPTPPIPTVSSMSSGRPALKIAALRGTKWDTGEDKKKAPKKATPRARAAPKPRPSVTKQPPVPTTNKAIQAKPMKATNGTNGTIVVNGQQESPDELIVASQPPAPQPVQLQSPTKPALGVKAAPKGILTPVKKRGRPPKSVKFNRSNGEEVFFEDLPKSTPRKRKTPAKEQQQQHDEDEIVCGICSRPHSEPPNEIILCDNCDFAVHQACYEVTDIPAGEWLCKLCSQEDVLKATAKTAEGIETAHATTMLDIPNLDQHLRTMQRVLLDRCSGRRRIQMFGQEEAYEKARQLVEQTIVAGEGNSMLLIGARGCGKTTLVEKIIGDVSREHRHDFHVVRLNGFIHTDDKLALREIWRQLGKEMKVEDDLMNRTNYADTMASLLALLSHPSEILGTDEGVTSQSVIFVIDEFDMFASHPRQTLLYNLFDIAQSRKAPIAVLGCTTRLDVVEMLEKRVKSRFSHRYIYLSLPKTLPAYWQVCRQGLLVERTEWKREGVDASVEGWEDFHKHWKHRIEELYMKRPFQDLLQYHYYTTKSAAAFLTEWMLPLSSLTASDFTLQVPTAGSETTSLTPPDSRMQLLCSLSELDLSMLISAARLDIVAHTDTVNFAMAYDEYSSLVGRQRVQSATSGMLAVGGAARVWSRGVAGLAWERLISLGLLVPSGLGGGRRMGHEGLDGKMWKVEVALEEIPTAVKLNQVLARWCREI
ncbi:origin recognition complex subunit 4 C-terminus-domain-containing protein [Stachybotrys elegans]|uniref:Origin recognition complex subunit 4 n=1 Tax=Stachybotrys elegans TaxID=80388 RepID=A0A8K0SXS5_9HYPO|nr:origin recognition complex subunit 4 C-terminus-domain-containing protein [Stachybotrys elegans]